MHRTTPLLEHALVRDPMRERVLEGVLGLRQQTALVQELGRLQPGQYSFERLPVEPGDRLQQLRRNVLADDRGRLEQALLLRREAIDPGCENRLHRGGNLRGLDRPAAR